jgi:DNA polymerase-3 subunit alpha
MKIKSITPLNDGMAQWVAEKYWSDLEGFAAYSFNLSHAAEYSLISWVTMWLKVYYPAEFFAAAMTVIEKEDQLTGLVADAQSKKLHVLPPDLNESSNRIEIAGEDKLYAPFQAIKGISSNVASAIMKLRAHAGGRFKDVSGIDPATQKIVLGGVKVTVAAREKLGRVGAFYALDGAGVAPTHPDRLKDRIELCPGFTVDMVKPDRVLNVEHLAKIKITSLIEEIRGCSGCSLGGAPHPLPRMGDKPKFLLVFDNPNWKEERAGKMLEGDGGDVIKAALKGVGLKAADGYYTALVKSCKPKEQKALTNEQINGCGEWLKKEIEILKPPVIIAMGTNSVRWFSPGIKGTGADLAGKVIYRSDLDATVVFGINPATLFHNPGNLKLIESTFERLGELLS